MLRIRRGGVAHLDQGQDGDNQLDGITQCRIEQTTEGLTTSQCRFFRGETEQPCEGDDGDEVGDETCSVRD